LSSSARRVTDPGRVGPIRWPRDPAAGVVDEAVFGVGPVHVADSGTRLAAIERDAFAKGYAQGERAGLEAGQARSEAMLQRLARTLQELADLRRTIAAQTEHQMVDLALAIAKRIVRREVEIDREFTIALARVALDRLGDQSPAVVRLHPDDAAIVARGGGDAGLPAHVRVVPDTAVGRGGCIVESDFGIIDATIERQFEELARALFVDEPAAVRIEGDGR
jgi:flagellar assembly protein FliH